MKPFFTPSRHEQLAASLGFTVSHDGTAVIGPDGAEVATNLSSDRLYHRLHFGPKKARKQVRVGRLQAWLKFGEALYADGIVVRHLDGNSFNNHWDNIGIGTQKENMNDRPPEVRRAHAIATSRFAMKYDHETVLAYYREFGWTLTCANFGIGKGALSFILRKSMASRAAVPA